MIGVARADRGDVEQVLQIADARRQQYAEYQPQFWRPARDAVDRQRAYVGSLLDNDEAFVGVARGGAKVRGFALARLVDAPAVYDPGGRTCLVDDFAVAEPDDWPRVGPMLLDAVRTWSTGQGATQLVVVVAQRDDAKRAVLRSAGLTIASEWWVGPI